LQALWQNLWETPIKQQAAAYTDCMFCTQIMFVRSGAISISRSLSQDVPLVRKEDTAAVRGWLILQPVEFWWF